MALLQMRMFRRLKQVLCDQASEHNAASKSRAMQNNRGLCFLALLCIYFPASLLFFLSVVFPQGKTEAKSAVKFLSKQALEFHLVKAKFD